MRSALCDLWPLELRRRRSKGLFDVPWQEAMQGLADTLLGKTHLNVVELGFIDSDSILSRLQRLSSGLDCNHSQLRNIIVLELWLRNRCNTPFMGNRSLSLQQACSTEIQKERR